MARQDPASAPSGLLVVDKPGGLTSHDVVAQIRRLAGTRRVGHAGTLDPMATGVLVIGLGQATRLLGYLTLTDKEYLATIRLGADTSTADAEGEITAGAVASGLTIEQVRAATAGLTGPIDQVPPAVSAIKVGGKRSYQLARAGAAPELAPRRVTVWSFTVQSVQPVGDLLDASVAVRCSSGTYVRALARDLGAALGVGGHLTMLRRTRVGPYDLAAAHRLDELAAAAAQPGGELPVLPLAAVAATAFPGRPLDAAEARTLSHGGRLPAQGLSQGPVAAFGPDGTLIALVEEKEGQARPLAVFVP
jgi:tRNA pseudouridine55 synthase